jgi:CO dehydrogenase/acetyl-CoA synthase gamma subunit (corrinoid Fe-S protein)
MFWRKVNKASINSLLNFGSTTSPEYLQIATAAWAAGKFSGPKVAKFVKDIKLEEHVVTRNLVIPGYAAAISGELEEALPNWKVVVGPQDAADLGSFIANYAHGQNTSA